MVVAAGAAIFIKKGAQLTPQVGADYVGGLCRRGRRPFGPRVVVSPLRGDEYEVSVTGFAISVTGAA